jgi:hypothetical protein
MLNLSPKLQPSRRAKAMILRLGLSALLLLGLVAFAAPALAAPAPKVEVCHIPPGNPDNFHTIVVSEKALKAHLGHDDFLGPCGAFCETLCDDGNACTQGACDENEQCINPPVDCNDSNTCTADSCDSALGCVNTPLEGEVCGVDNPGACTETNGVCDTFGACEPTPIEGCCTTDQECTDADEDLCSIEACIDNSCQPVDDVDCSTDACSVSVCEPATGTCTTPEPVVCNEPACNLNGCDPANGCFSIPIEGCCESDAECGDGNNCTTDTCNGVNGCENVPCAEGDACNTLVACDAGTCAPTLEPVECSDDGNLCTNETCNDVEGGCVAEMTICFNGEECNPESGACVPTEPEVTCPCFDEAAVTALVASCTSAGLPITCVDNGTDRISFQCNHTTPHNICNSVHLSSVHYNMEAAGPLEPFSATCSARNWDTCSPDVVVELSTAQYDACVAVMKSKQAAVCGP